MRLKIFTAELMAIIFALCACFDSTETENRKYVVLMGIDGNNKYEEISENNFVIGNEGEYIMSAGEAELGSDIGQRSEEQKTILVRGDTLPEMRMQADMYSSKKMYFGQLKAVVIGEDIFSDETKLADTVYTMERMDDINTKIVVFAADTAANTVEAVMAKGSKGGLYLWDYYKNNGGETDISEYMNFEGMIKTLRQGGTFVIPRISVDGEEVFLDGGAVISGGVYRGYITTDDIRNTKWIKGKAENELITAGGVSAKVRRQRTEIVEEEDMIKIYISAEISLESSTDNVGTERLFEEEVKRSLTESLNKAISMEADFIGLGDDRNLMKTKFEIYPDIQIISAGVIK